ncbi:MAG: sugar phosphate isomerase/epimerase [Thermomicrobium sp.]|nr:sugar phosphate isomerase/epimerase [Thermomicrobium sp.]
MSEPFNWRFAAIADEIDPDLAPALDVMREVGILALELRSAWGKGVLDLDEDELHAVHRETSRRGMIVPVIASPIGKSLITEPIEFELRRLDRALAIAQRLDSWGIRLFSFYLPSGCPPDQYREAILERFQRFVTRAAAAGIVLLHENEKDIYGDIPERCHDLLKTIDSPWLRAVWDPANFVQCGVHPYQRGFPLLAPYIAHVHIKDARLATGEVTPAGEGDGEVAETLAALAAARYEGYLSLEPHLLSAGRQGGFSGRAAFLRAHAALQRLLEQLSAA